MQALRTAPDEGHNVTVVIWSILFAIPRFDIR